MMKKNTTDKPINYLRITGAWILGTILFAFLVFIVTDSWKYLKIENVYEDRLLSCNSLSSCDKIMCKIKIREEINYPYDSNYLYTNFNNCVLTQKLYKEYKEVTE